MSLLSVTDADGVAVLRIERPPANALAPELLAEGAEVVERLRAEAPAAVVITGSGSFFSGGVDLKLTPTLPESEQRGMVTEINRLFCDWFGFPRPVVAAVNGHAVAGGLILALCADRRIGARGATYGLTEVRVGAPYPAAALAVVREELGPVAVRRLVLGGELHDAETTLELGALDELLEPEAVLPRSLEVAHEMAALPTATFETVKAQLRGEALASMLAAAAEDPLASGWLSSEMPDAARAALER